MMIRIANVREGNLLRLWGEDENRKNTHTISWNIRPVDLLILKADYFAIILIMIIAFIYRAHNKLKSQWLRFLSSFVPFFSFII